MRRRILASVGTRGKNLPKDTKLVQALLNVYARQACRKTLSINGKCSDTTIASITHFQQHEVKLTRPDGRIDPHGRSFRMLRNVLRRVLRDGQPLLKPNEGIVTFDSEGSEGGPYHSRILHVPSTWSGLTLGRGYDMKQKSAAKIIRELTKAGVSSRHVQILARAHGMRGEAAKQFIIDNDLLDFQISPLVQKRLFLISYAEISKETERVCTRKSKEMKAYGSCDWKKLNNQIKQMVIDLKFRGDYTVETRKFIQKPIVDNNLDAFKKVMKKSNNWSAVPKDRFNRRVKYLE